MKTDEQLMQIYTEGDLSAFEELYKRYKNRVYGFLAKKITNSSQQDDVFQLVFMKLHQKKHLYNTEYSFSPWFFTLINNTIIDHYRKNKRNHDEIDLDNYDEEVKHINNYDLEEINNLGLDEKQYQLLYLKFVEGHGYKELEKEFNTSASALRKRVSRLLKSLRDLKQRGSHE